MNWYYWVQANRVKMFIVIVVLGLLVIIFVKSELWASFFEGAITVSVLYLIGVLFQKIKDNKSPKMEE